MRRLYVHYVVPTSLLAECDTPCGIDVRPLQFYRQASRIRWDTIPRTITCPSCLAFLR